MLNEIWNGIFPVDGINWEPVGSFPADERVAYFGFVKDDVKVLVFMYIDESVIEIDDLEGDTTVELFIEVDEQTMWSVIDEFLDSNQWGLCSIEKQSREWMLEGAKAEAGTKPDQ